MPVAARPAVNMRRRVAAAARVQRHGQAGGGGGVGGRWKMEDGVARRSSSGAKGESPISRCRRRAKVWAKVWARARKAAEAIRVVATAGQLISTRGRTWLR